MTGSPNEIPEFPVTDSAVRAAMVRILGTAPFLRDESASRLLKYAVDETLAGHTCKLKAGQSDKLRVLLSAYYAGEGIHDSVRIVLPKEGKAPVFSTTATPAPPPARRRWIWGPIALSVVALVFWTGTWWRAWSASRQVRSLAILPFADGNPESGGITRGVIDALAGIRGLHVAAGTSVFASQDRAGDLAAVGRQLGVSAVLRGTLSHSGDRWRVAVYMDRVADGYRLWSATLDEPADGLPAVPQRLASAIARRIQIPVPAPKALYHRPPLNAYAPYLQARDLFKPAQPQDLDKAAGLLEESTRLDPDFALAWAWLAIVREYRVAAGIERPNRGMPASRDAAERAAALDPDCGDCHLALGIVRLQYDWDWAAAKDELDRALQASPESALALEWHAHWYETQGRLDEAMAEMQRALALDPLSSVLSGEVAGQYLAVNQPERAIPFAQKAVDLAPADAGRKAALAEVLLQAGQKDKAQHLNAELLNSGLPPYLLASLSAQLDEPEPARLLLNQAEDLPGDELLPAVAYVELAAALQDWDRCFAWIEEAYGERDGRLPYLRLHPLLPKSDPHFADYLERMNLPAPPSK